MLDKIKSLVLMTLVGVLIAISVTPALAAAPGQQDDLTIVDIAVQDGSFTSLVKAVEAAGLVDTLKGEGPFTVFAPTDDAFAALPEGTLDSLFADPEGALKDVLLYHVVSGKVTAADVLNLATADTVLGQSLKVTVDAGNVKINDAQVVITDIEASNGVIHVIDTVLIPPSLASSTGTPKDSKVQPDQPQMDNDRNKTDRPHYDKNRQSNRYGYQQNYRRGHEGRNYYKRNNYGRNHYYGKQHSGSKYYYGYGKQYNRSYYNYKPRYRYSYYGYYPYRHGHRYYR